MILNPKICMTVVISLVMITFAHQKDFRPQSIERSSGNDRALQHSNKILFADGTQIKTERFLKYVSFAIAVLSFNTHHFTQFFYLLSILFPL